MRWMVQSATSTIIICSKHAGRVVSNVTTLGRDCALAMAIVAKGPR
jgi:hypothetical protein